ncbi:hypothetical protein H6770_02215 [Candidatus Peribacteria bacterium]|nr:hypothetical protein [Candidatus Peribacteria bacterium]
MSVEVPDFIAEYPFYTERFQALTKEQREALTKHVQGVQAEGEGQLEMRYFSNGYLNRDGEMIYFSTRDLAFASLKGTHLGKEWLQTCVNLHDQLKQ